MPGTGWSLDSVPLLHSSQCSLAGRMGPYSIPVMGLVHGTGPRSPEQGKTKRKRVTQAESQCDSQSAPGTACCCGRGLTGFVAKPQHTPTVGGASAPRLEWKGVLFFGAELRNIGKEMWGSYCSTHNFHGLCSVDTKKPPISEAITLKC